MAAEPLREQRWAQLMLDLYRRSTEVWDYDPSAMADALERHDGSIGRTVADHHGVLRALC